MIRRWPAFVAGAVALALPSPAPAEGLRVHVNGGVAFPTSPGEFSEFWETGFSVGGGVGVWTSPHWEIVGAFHFQRYAANEERQIADLFLQGGNQQSEVASIDGRDAKVVTLTAEARLHVPTSSPTFSPFLVFGAGYFGISTSDAQVTAELEEIGTVTVLGDQEDAFGATIGLGLECALSPKLDLVLDSIYTIGFTETVSTQYLPIRLGLAFD